MLSFSFISNHIRVPQTLAWDLLVHPDRLDLWLARDGVDQIHQLPILSEDPLLNPRHSARRKSSLGDPSLITSDIMGSAQIDKFKNYLVLGQCVSTESSSCLNFGPISGRLQEGDAKFKIDRGRLEGGGGVDAHCVPSQVLVCCSRIERAGNLRRTRFSEVNVAPGVDKPGRLIIRLLYGFASDSVLTNPTKISTNNQTAMLSTQELTMWS